MHELFEPGGGGFNLPGHMGKLEADNGMIDERLTEGAAFMGIFHSFFVANAGETKALDDDADAFMVEVRHYYYSIMLVLLCRASTSL